jgi:putative ABC transport system permease protein
MRWGLFREILVMSWDTVRGNKLRSFLTVLGIVIGITSIVGMTAMIRGFDQSIRDVFRSLGPNTVYVTKMSAVSFSAGKTFRELVMRPNITQDDAAAIERAAPSIEVVDLSFGDGGRNERMFYKNLRTRQMPIVGATSNWPYAINIPIAAGRFFSQNEVERRSRVVVLGKGPAEVLFPNVDPLGKSVRIGLAEFVVVGVCGKRPSPGGFNVGVDDFAVIPVTTYAKQYGIRLNDEGRGTMRGTMVAAVPREGVPVEQAMKEIEEIMRVRHGLKLDEPNDFDLVTQDAFLAIWEQISQATFLALVVLSSIALMVGGIGVMSIMTISVTERTREIGVRKALGARRTEVLWQFLLEAIFLTSAGGLLGIVCGTSIGLLIHAITGFPISLPWWAFAIGIGFSAGVGVFFGMFPAIRASRLDPIEALRYE